MTIPFYVAGVYGANVLYPKEYHGGDDVNGYIRKNDYMYFRVDVAIDDDTEITNNQVLFGLANLEFNCKPGTYYTGDCDFTVPADTRSDAERYLINVYADDWVPGDDPVLSLDNFLYVDEIAPVVDSLSIESPLPSSDGSVVIKYTVRDRAVQDCTGISKIEFYENNLDYALTRTPDHEEEIDGNPGVCTKTGYVTYTTGISKGTVKLCALPYDNFGQNAVDLDTLPSNYLDTWCIDFTVDQEVPNVIAGTLKIIDDEGREVAPGPSTGFFGSGGRKVTISVDVLEDSLVSVYGDFSQLNKNPSIAAGYVHMLASCVPDPVTPDLKTCTWGSAPNYIELEPDVSLTTVSKPITITATDSSVPPNEGLIVIPKNFKLDSIGPEVTKIETLFYDSAEDVYYSNASGNTFIASITENGIGIEPEDISLHLKDVVAVAADNCTETGAGLWGCIWYNFPAKDISDTKITEEGIIGAYIDTSDSSDIIGNPVIQQYREDIVFDLFSPSVASKDKATTNTFGFYSNGYTLTITADVKDMSPVTATANLEDVVLGAGESRVQCTAVSGDVGELRTWRCEWSDVINTTSVGDIEVDILFEDFVGYTSEDSITIPIAVEETEEVPDFFSLGFMEEYLVPIDKGIICNADCSQQYLASEFYPQIAPFYLDLGGGEMNCPGTLTILPDTVIIDGCEATFMMNEDADHPGSFIGFITYQIDVDPLLMNFIATEDYVTLAPDCYLKFKVKCETPAGTKVYAWSEAELITLNVPFSETTTPDTPEDFTDIIDRIERDFEGLFNVIDTLNKILTLLNNICQIRGMVTTILQTIALIGIGFSLCTDAGSPYCTPIEATARGITGGYGAWWEEFQQKLYLQEICGFVNCAGRDAGAPAETVPDLPYGYDLMCKETAGGGQQCNAKPKKLCDWLRVWSWLGAQTLARGGSGEFAGSLSAFQADTLTLSKRSLLFAGLCGCIPGVVYNIRKWLEIECWRGICYRDLIPTGAVTKQDCEKQHDYNMCVYIMGVFAPLFAVVEAPIAAIAEFLLNPIATGWEAVRMLTYHTCRQASVTGPCATGSGTCFALKWESGCKWYMVWQTLTNIAEVTQYEDQLGQMEWNWDDVKQGDQTSYCSILFK